ncbi:MAG: helix-turn-helix domain-containing protein [Caulobacteraceae bacterium]
MSISAMRWTLQLHPSWIDNPGARYVLLVLSDNASEHDDGELDWVCWPGVEYIMARTSMSERTVERHLFWLIGQGWISRVANLDRARREARFIYVLHRERSALERADDPDVLAQLRARLDVKLDGGRNLRIPVILTGNAARQPANLTGKGERSPVKMTGGKAKARPVVHKSGTPERLPVNLTCELSQSPVNLAGSEGATTRQFDADHPSICRQPPVNLTLPPTPPYIAEPLLNPHLTSACAGADDGDEFRFDEGFAAYPESGRLRTDLPAARDEWLSCCLVVDAALLVAAVRRYAAEDRDIKRGDYGAPAFEKWLEAERWRGWLPSGGAKSATNAVRFDGWPGVRDAVVAELGEGWVASYLDPCTTSAADRSVIPRTSTGRDKLKREAAPILKRFGVVVADQIQSSAGVC